MNPMQATRRKMETAPMTTLTITEKKLNELLTNKYIPAAHRALWALLWEGEIRLNEALMLDVRDFDLDARTVSLEYRVKPGTGSVPVSERAVELLQEAFAGETEGPAIHRFGRPISRRGAAVIARSHGVSIHAFRHSGPRRPDYAASGTTD